MKTYDYYCILAETLEEAASLISRPLGVNFARHEAEGLGPYLLYETEPGRGYKIICNFDGEDWREKDFTEYRYILQCNAIANPGHAEKILSELSPRVVFVRRAEVEVGKYIRQFGKVDGELVLLSEKKLK